MVLGREVGAKVETVGTYEYGPDAVTLYETDSISTFLNLPERTYANYSAWFQIPGDGQCWRRGFAQVQFLDTMFKMPDAVGRRVPNGCKDLFSYLSRCYFKTVKEAASRRLFDLVYVAASENALGIEDFVEKTAVKW